MHDIDFLPIEYRQRDAARQIKPWRIVVVTVFLLLLGATAYLQFRQGRSVEKELAAVEAFYARAESQNVHAADFHAKLQVVQGEASLYTFLRHPWPRTQLLSAVATPLPKELAISQIQIGSEASTELAQSAETHSRADRKAEEEKAKKLPASQRDLKRLHDENDKMQTFVRIAGMATDAGALHRYLTALNRADLFLKAELRSIESVESLTEKPQLRFHAVLVVRPGFGQPAGPEGKTEAKAEGGKTKKPAEKAPVSRFAPEGHLKIAQRFIAGVQTRDWEATLPAINRWAIIKRPCGTSKEALHG